MQQDNWPRVYSHMHLDDVYMFVLLASIRARLIEELTGLIDSIKGTRVFSLFTSARVHNTVGTINCMP